MPTYDYECRNCGQRIEVLHGVNENGPTACARCGGPMRKLMSTPNIVFKGSGWAKKDARDARPAAKASSTTGKSDAGEASSTTDANSSGESAPAVKPIDGAASAAKKEPSTGAPSAD